MEDTIVLYPSPGMGHLVPMVELGKLILTHNPSFSIIILITTVPFDTGSTTAPYISRVSTTTASIHFHHLPTISPPSTSSSNNNIAALAFEFTHLYNPNLHHALETLISQKSRPKASVIDFFCSPSFEVFTSLHIPTYYFCPSSASGLSCLLLLPTTHQTIIEKIKDPNTSIEFPGVPPIPTPDMPVPFFDTEGIAFKGLISAGISIPKSSGILTNTFCAFEPRAVKAISDGLCTPNSPAPSIYCIGPLIEESGEVHEHDCLRWLDSQPSQSVVFLCFGSMGLFKAEQLMEIAIGLEKSGHRFLWVLRSPPADGETKSSLAKPEPDLDVLLPDGFLDRTRGRGLVVTKWAPQVAVLSHDSVGGFVTHCGWNSILEAVRAGVPMVGWPLYAEQRLNRVLLVEEMKVALALEESEGGFVSADELEKRVSASAVARQILEKIPGNNDMNVSYSQDRYIFHVKRTDGLTVLCMADDTAGRRIPFAFLEDIHQRFVRTYGRAVLSAHAYGMNDEFSRVLSQQMEYYSNDPNADRINRLKGEMSQVRNVMIENIDKVLERGDRLELLVDKTANMQGNTFRFRKQARRFRSNVWWRNVKLTIALIILLLVIAYIVLAFVCKGPLLPSCV